MCSNKFWVIDVQYAYDPLSDSAELLDGLLVHGVDGASFGGSNAL
jgi:hypothetical protein